MDVKIRYQRKTVKINVDIDKSKPIDIEELSDKIASELSNNFFKVHACSSLGKQRYFLAQKVMVKQKLLEMKTWK